MTKTMRYTHDMMHCSQQRCPRHGDCYRYWLGENCAKHGHITASFYHPNPGFDLEQCHYFINKNDY